MSWLLPGLVVWPLVFGALAAVFNARWLAFIGAAGVGLMGLALVQLPYGDWMLGGWASPLGIGWRLDFWSQGMLVLTALVGLMVSLYAWFDRTLNQHFWVLWLGAWGAMNALYLAADLFNVYVTLELLGLSAVAMVALSGKFQALQAAMRYLLVSLLGSMLFLMAIALLYGQYTVLDMRALAGVMQPGLAMSLALAFMSAGLLAKTALFPLHAWLPLAHGRAPAAVSAILSALVIKAAFYLLIRLWLEVFAPLQSSALIGFWLLLGSAAILWGSWQALMTANLKRLVAWSTVAQVGYLVIALALVASPDTPLAVKNGLLWMIIAHALAKSAMFLAAGNVQSLAGHDQLMRLGYVWHRSRMNLFAFALAGVSLAGLPISAGFLAKWWLLSLAIDHQAWWLVVLIILGGLLTAAYVVRVLNIAVTAQSQPQHLHELAVERSWIALSLALLAIVTGLGGQWFWGGLNG